MPVDPRRTAGTNDGERTAQRLRDLEKRVDQMSMATKGAVLATGIVEQTPAASAQFLTTTITDITNVSVTLTAQVPTIAVVTLLSDLSIDYNTTPQQSFLYLYVDGAALPINCQLGGFHGSGTITSQVRSTTGKSWRVALSAGSHTIKVRGARTNTVGSTYVVDCSMTYIQTRA